MTEQEERDTLSSYSSSVLDKGYGAVGKLVMQDRRLSIGAKAIYAYLCTFGNVAFPGRQKICFDLGISTNTYTKHMNQLVDLAYISIVQTRKGGRFKSNEYRINIVPSMILEARKARNEADSTVSQKLVHGDADKCPHRVAKNGAPKNGAPKIDTHNITRNNIPRDNKTTAAATEIETREDRARIRRRRRRFFLKSPNRVSPLIRKRQSASLWRRKSRFADWRRNLLPKLTKSERFFLTHWDPLASARRNPAA